MNNTLTYTSFESVKTISEGANAAVFDYNADGQRVRMEVTQSGTAILKRWYPTGSCIKEEAGGVTKTYTFVGGNAYTAPVVAVQQGSTTTWYYLLRDHLGSITRVINAATKVVAAEYSYDAWGRMRNPATWVPFAPGAEPALIIAGRGYTGHEHLPWFKLINMNGRLYEPLSGLFLSPDNYVQAPGYTQSFNRYGLCFNNPLKYTDPSGEKWKWWHLGVLDFLTGGMISMGATTMATHEIVFSFADALGQSYIWEAPHNQLVYSYTQWKNDFGKVDRVDYLGGATFATEYTNETRDGISLGSFINIRNNIEIEGDFAEYVISDPLYMHEYGHTFDSKRLGPVYLFAVGLPSLISANNAEQVKGEPTNVTTHDFRVYEMRANKYAADYFGKYYGVDWLTLYRSGTFETYYPRTKR
jgi:RHS repeat-associated protein